ncbi:MAG: methyl-accepting chemotaxis protein [Alphaproteobacteria bacterium]|uniref:Methyl-accepting chemotaxis protein n=1 Tax=Candidatus Nitrobium versatile TaxID=2884831 RepID=A0A953LZK9_9BACT|nr:methyl-accepting chemotaxis protein [Candidatus Nitrobium versatile]
MKLFFRKTGGVHSSLNNQVFLFSVIPMIVVFCILTYLAVSTIIGRGEEKLRIYRNMLLNERKEMIRGYTDLAVRAIETLPRNDAERAIKRLKYGKNGYFWINDFNHFMISHPDPKLEGRDTSDLRDPNGVYILKEIVRVCRENGEGFVAYSWKTPNDERLQPKISYAKAIGKWNWIVGTGIYVNDIDETVVKEKERIQREVAALIRKIIIMSLVVMAVLIFLVRFFVDRLINKPAEKITETVKRFDNDLTVRIPVTTRNEIGELASWFNHYIEGMRDVVSKVSGAVAGITSYAHEVSRAVEQQATVASQQSAAVAEITSTMEELSASSTQIADHSHSVVGIASKTWEDTKKGANAVESVIFKMNEIHNDNQASIREIVELGRKSKEISKVMEIINSIADQTKLIAFNAALEASSAGESGRRFGVVAVEIRRLADSVMESTGEIEAKINEIQEAINRLVIASEKGSKGIQEGMEYSNQTATLLIDIVDAAQATTDAARQISLSTQQQKTASNQVVTALREIVAGAGQTSDSINQISAISRELSALSDDLKHLVERFKVQETPAAGGEGR